MKYSLTTEENVRVGYFEIIEGLDGTKSIVVNRKKFSFIRLRNFYPSDMFFNELLLKEGEKENLLGILYVNIHGSDGKIIGSYGIFSYKKIIFHVGAQITIDIIVNDFSKSLPYAIDIWNIWRNSIPTTKNRWKMLKKEEKRAWVEVTRKAHCAAGIPKKDSTKITIFLNGNNITDIPSFFCAIGEAINGPGGYFGETLEGFEDCLCGGFGLIPPFKLIWKNAEISKKNLTKKEWEKELNVKNQNTIKGQLKHSFFFVVLEILKKHAVEIVLK
jgi:RNAse (barnase) inhibitor barstar